MQKIETYFYKKLNSVYYNGYAKLPEYGIFRTTLVQGQNRTVQVWSIDNFLTWLSNVGGTIVSLYGLFGIIVGSYQSFIMDKSMLK